MSFSHGEKGPGTCKRVAIVVVVVVVVVDENTRHARERGVVVLSFADVGRKLKPEEGGGSSRVCRKYVRVRLSEKPQLGILRRVGQSRALSLVTIASFLLCGFLPSIENSSASLRHVIVKCHQSFSQCVFQVLGKSHPRFSVGWRSRPSPFPREAMREATARGLFGRLSSYYR